jgi:hypothetical protein
MVRLLLPPGNLGLLANDQVPTYFFLFSLWGFFTLVGRADGSLERRSVCAGMGMYTLLSPKSWLYAGVELGSAQLQLKKSTQSPKLGAGFHSRRPYLPLR